jgi:hypothetical protein
MTQFSFWFFFKNFRITITFEYLQWIVVVNLAEHADWHLCAWIQVFHATWLWGQPQTNRTKLETKRKPQWYIEKYRYILHTHLRENLREYSEDPLLLYLSIYCMNNGHKRTMGNIYTLCVGCRFVAKTEQKSQRSEFGVWAWKCLSHWQLFSKPKRQQVFCRFTLNSLWIN